MVSNNNNLVKKYMGIGLILASFAAIIMMISQTTTNDIWYDEVFSVDFARLKITDLIAMTARDVHPPLYYIYLKLITGIFCGIFGDDCFVTVSKIASVLPWGVMVIIALTYIRKRWGYFVSGAFLFLITVMPQLGNYYVEIRMYSFALMLITICGLSVFSIIERDDNNIVSWGVFWVCGILTAYTQYYALIGVVGVYFATLLGLIIVRKDDSKRQLLRWAICALLSVIFYMPWIPVVLKQMSNISGNYWIQPLSLRSIGGCVKFIILPVADKEKLCLVAAGLVLIAMIVVTVLLFISRREQAVTTAIICLMPIIIVILSGFVLSALGTPIFVYRYMIPVMGLMWLFIAIAIDGIEKSVYTVVMFLIPFILAGILTCRGVFLEEHKKVTHMPDVIEAFEGLPNGAVVVANFDHVAAISGFYLPDNEIYLYEGDIDPILTDLMKGCGKAIDDSEILNMLDGGRDVYFFGSFNSRDDIINDWEGLNITANETDSILLERYWFNIYRLEKQ
ncbi:MAG: hypothetical protein KBS96_01390 [Lachnospiraceae bacterium]|nr:hypothetical protein [Candidatus Colinaster scatohippi]